MSFASLATTRKADRKQIADEIQRICKIHGVACERTEESDQIALDLDVRGQVRCRVGLVGTKKEENVFVLPWNTPPERGDNRRLSQAVFENQVNRHHGQKATMVVRGIEDLRQHLIHVFCAAGEGRIFQQTETQTEDSAVLAVERPRDG